MKHLLKALLVVVVLLVYVLPVTAEGDDHVFDVRDLSRMPIVTVQTPPKYPPKLLKAGVDGRVFVGFVVDAVGNVVDASVLESTDQRFDKEALRTVSAWKFIPGKIDGRNVSARMSVPIVFSAKPDKRPAFEGPAIVSGEVYSIDDVEVKPVLKHQVKPKFPGSLQKAGVSGQASVQFVVTKEGRVARLTVISATHAPFGDAALEAVSGWIFEPGTRDGVPVNTGMWIKLVFDLKN